MRVAGYEYLILSVCLPVCSYLTACLTTRLDCVPVYQRFYLYFLGYCRVKLGSYLAKVLSVHPLTIYVYKNITSVSKPYRHKTFLSKTALHLRCARRTRWTCQAAIKECRITDETVKVEIFLTAFIDYRKQYKGTDKRTGWLISHSINCWTFPSNPCKNKTN